MEVYSINTKSNQTSLTLSEINMQMKKMSGTSGSPIYCSPLTSIESYCYVQIFVIS